MPWVDGFAPIPRRAAATVRNGILSKYLDPLRGASKGTMRGGREMSDESKNMDDQCMMQLCSSLQKFFAPLHMYA